MAHSVLVSVPPMQPEPRGYTSKSPFMIPRATYSFLVHQLSVQARRSIYHSCFTIRPLLVVQLL